LHHGEIGPSRILDGANTMNDLAAELSPPFPPHRRLQDLLDALGNAGYTCIGPTLKNGAIVFEPVAHISDMPRGVTTVQRRDTIASCRGADHA
jgi:hypothetical protein